MTNTKDLNLNGGGPSIRGSFAGGDDNLYGLAKPTVGSDNNSWGNNGWSSPTDTAIGLNDNMEIIEIEKIQVR